jgi:phosphoglycerate dehydrogenase-like enzyme
MPAPTPPSARTKAILVINQKHGESWTRMQQMYSADIRHRIARSFALHPEVLTSAEIRAGHPAALSAKAFFGTWGFPRLTTQDLKPLENPEMVFFAAGSVKAFGAPLLEAGIPICTAKLANARVVAEVCVAQITLAAKNFFGHARAFNRETYPPEAAEVLSNFPGLNRSRIALIGCGVIAREVIARLGTSQFDIHVVDPFLSTEEATLLGVTRCSMDEAFQSCHVVSNHLPNMPELNQVLNKSHFSAMQPHATFIKTGRGAQVNEPDLIEVFSSRPDLTALLDVTHPEPPESGSALYRLPNVLLTPHIAGCIGDEFSFLVNEVVASSERWLRGEALENLESLEKLNISA